MSYTKLKDENLAEESLSEFAGAPTAQLTAETVLDLCERFKRGEPAGVEGGLGGLPAIARGAHSEFLLQKELEPETTEALALASTKSGEGKVIDTAKIRGGGNHARAHPLYSGWNVMAQLSLRLSQASARPRAPRHTWPAAARDSRLGRGRGATASPGRSDP